MTRLTASAGLIVAIGIAALVSVLAAPDPAAERFWAQWRGPYASGFSKHANPPVEWSETRNVRWKVGSVILQRDFWIGARCENARREGRA